MKRILPGDTVEIETFAYSSLDRIPKEIQSMYEETKTPIPMIGTRFVVSHNRFGVLYTEFINSSGAKDGCQMSVEGAVKLIKRPIKNWIKIIFTK